MGREQRAKDRKRLRRVVEGQEFQTVPEGPEGEMVEVMVCECGRVYRYGRGAWIPITEGEAHSHVLRFARTVM